MQDKRVSDVSEAVEEYRYAILQLSEETQVWYMARLKRFAAWCTDAPIQLKQIKPTTIAKYLHELATHDSERTGMPLSTHTVHGHARTIRTFLFWCAADPQCYLSEKVPANIVMPKMRRKIIETFDSLQIKALFAACEKEMTRTMVMRDKAIIAVLVDTGIRASELCDLSLEHVYITPHEGYIRVCGKGDKEREIGLGVKSRTYLHSYIKQYREAVPAEQHVFLSHKRTPLTRNGLDQIIYRLAERAKITGVQCSAHVFRHTMACNYLLQGGDVYSLSRLMGHTSVQVTEIYLRAIKAEQARKTSKSVLDNL